MKYQIILKRINDGKIVTDTETKECYRYPVCLRCMNAEGNYEYEDLPDFIYLQYQELIEKKGVRLTGQMMPTM